MPPVAIIKGKLTIAECKALLASVVEYSNGKLLDLIQKRREAWSFNASAQHELCLDITTNYPMGCRPLCAKPFRAVS